MSLLLLIAMFVSSVVAQNGHPEFDPPTEKVVLEEGSLAKVECVAKGESPLTYAWYNQNDAEIPSDANEEVFSRRSDVGCSLIFGEVKLSHAGLYSCKASNRHGSASKPYDVMVNGTSGNITTNETGTIDHVKVINVTDSSVEFAVQTTGDPDSFYIRYQEKLDKNQTSVHIKRGDRALVRDLLPGGRYQFWFQIEDPSRVTVPSTPHDVVLLPGVPDVVFRSVRDGMVTVEWFVPIDEFTRKTIEEFELSYNNLWQVSGKTWRPGDCVITVRVPRGGCYGSRYTIADIQKDIYYEIRVRARTATGYGRPYVNKVRVL